VCAFAFFLPGLKIKKEKLLGEKATDCWAALWAYSFSGNRVFKSIQYLKQTFLPNVQEGTTNLSLLLGQVMSRYDYGQKAKEENISGS